MKRSAKLTEEAVVETADQTVTEETVSQQQELLQPLQSKKRSRVWEVDFLRGIMILFVVWDHVNWTVRQFSPFHLGFMNTWADFVKVYRDSAVRDVTQPVFVTMFVFTSGMSCSFSRNNGKRAIKMMVCALSMTAVTWIASFVVKREVFILFNVIHVIALSVALWTFIEWAQKKCVKQWQKNIFGFVMVAVILTALVVGSVANLEDGGWKNQNPMWFFLADHQSSQAFSDFKGSDYLPFFPDFGWFLVGAFLGQLLYKEKKTLFPSVNPKWVSPITFCGRNSIWIYFGSETVAYGLLYALSPVL